MEKLISIETTKQTEVGKIVGGYAIKHPLYLNLLNFPWFHVHKLHLKVGSVIKLIRNVSIKHGLYNGTCLQTVNAQYKVHKFN